jgi:predicted transcriptional regulator
MPSQGSRERNEESGRFKSEHGVTKKDVFEFMEGLEPYSTREIAEGLGAPRRTVYNFLEELHQEGKIRKKKPDPRSAVWFRGN